ncbi:glycosyltransferase family 2 protein [Gemmatimonadota bacterium]
MDVSVIVSTYNQPAWLEKVLWGYSRQDCRDFELVIADDGSGPETRDLIAGFARGMGFPLRHIWHEDEGYRRSTILNAAILAAEGDYLVFSDGDCVPRHDFVKTHVEMAEPGRFLSGGSVYLSKETSKRLTREDILSGRFADPRWLRSQGQHLGRHGLRLLPRGWRATLLDRLTTTNPTWNLNNASTWREPIFEVNGMESEMQYGGADRALGSRLENLGLRGKLVRFRAVLLHLDHERPYKTRDSIRKNKGIRRRIEEEKETRARDGLAELKARIGSKPYVGLIQRGGGVPGSPIGKDVERPPGGSGSGEASRTDLEPAEGGVDRG